MLTKKQFLSVLFCTSSGSNEDNLGSDEHEIIDIGCLIIDVNKLQVINKKKLSKIIQTKWKSRLPPNKKKTLDVCHYFLKPKQPTTTQQQQQTASSLSAECTALTGYTDELILSNSSAIYLDEFVKQVKSEANSSFESNLTTGNYNYFSISLNFRSKVQQQQQKSLGSSPIIKMCLFFFRYVSLTRNCSSWTFTRRAESKTSWLWWPTALCTCGKLSCPNAPKKTSTCPSISTTTSICVENLTSLSPPPHHSHPHPPRPPLRLYHQLPPRPRPRLLFPIQHQQSNQQQPHRMA